MIKEFLQQNFTDKNKQINQHESQTTAQLIEFAS